MLKRRSAEKTPPNKSKMLTSSKIFLRRRRKPLHFLRYTHPALEKLTFPKAVFLYMLGGTLGNLWEIIFNLVKVHRYFDCSGSIFTPFNPVYGLGLLAIVFTLRKLHSPVQIFCGGALLGGAIEYALSCFEEYVLGVRSWNYSSWPLNINGRTTVPIMLFWGILCVIVIFLLYRPLDRFFERIPRQFFYTAAIFFFCIICADMFFNAVAMFRYVARADGIEPFSAFGEWIDQVFPDSFMKRRFPSTKIG